MPKITELWAEVEKTYSEGTPSGFKMAVLEGQKVLEAVLDSKGYPGKTVEDKLFWAGYSLKDKDGIKEAIDKRNEILTKFDYRLTDLEAGDIVRKYKHVIDEIAHKPAFGFVDRLKMFAETQFSPKSWGFWRNIAAFTGFFALITILSRTTIGIDIVDWLILTSGLIISWQFLVVIGIAIAIYFAVTFYLSQRSKVRIKEDDSQS